MADASIPAELGQRKETGGGQGLTSQTAWP